MTYFTRFAKKEYSVTRDSTKTVTDLSQYTAFLTKLTDNISYYTYYTMKPDERFDTISNNLYGTVDYYWTIPLLNPTITNTFRDTIKSTVVVDHILQRKYPGKCIQIEDSDTLAGKFQIGEIVQFYDDAGNGPVNYKLREKYTNLNYLVVNSIDNDSNQSVGTVTGQKSGSVADVSIIIDYALATHHYVDVETNERVPYYRENTYPVPIPEFEKGLNEEYTQIKVIRPEFISDIVDQFEEQMKKSR